MEDIQDGYKESIQDGKKERVEYPLLIVSSGTARTFIASTISHPQVTTIVKTFTNDRITATMSTIVATQVT